ncbi:cyclic nucleotide-binding domain-containing protein [Anaerocolumna sp. AGMB13025]|uniref:cyclic nucleotide-binding domain-containing protein n=1 Tax=Anaerocolumna sp. AGMB13025 TaxID=3039116 RepID=UPI00241CEC1A|nr:cyclic nucleotide-binding domain-containing protein [Anaerocolumna sp. AGMB13025]WFR59297.1 cyclic nucleotide-binding domain-containing protein [Anaerocolumna sp. AGMB13025]
MQKLNDSEKLKGFIREFEVDRIFSKDMRSYMELFFYKKNEYMVKDNEKMQYLIFIVKGKAKVFTTLSNGKSLLLCFYQDFMVLGDMELIGSQTAVTNIQVIEDTYCIGLAFNRVRSILIEDTKFLKFICGSLGNKLYRCSKNSSINILYSLENRLASYIYTTGERIIIPGNKESKIIFRENLTEIAEVLGTSYRHLLRTLSELCKKGILYKEEDRYEVTDEKTLVKLSADLYR